MPPPQMLYISDNAHLTSRQVAKFHGVTPFDPKFHALISYILSQFLASLEKLLGGPLFPVGFGLARLGHSVARVKISGRSTPLEAEICMVFRKSRFCAYNCTSKSP